MNKWVGSFVWLFVVVGVRFVPEAPFIVCEIEFKLFWRPTFILDGQLGTYLKDELGCCC